MTKPAVFEQYARDTTAFVASVPVNAAFVTYFKPALKAWHKAHGSVCTPQQLTVAVLLTNNHRSPGVECLSTAMSLRPGEGYEVAQYTSLATTSNIKGDGKAVGPANNKRKALLAAGLIDFVVTQKPFRFQTVLTPKGIKWLQNAMGVEALKAQGAAATAKPVKAKAKPAVTKKAKVKKAKPVISEPVTVDPAVTVEVQPVIEPVIAEPVTETALSDLAAHFNS